MIFGPSVRFLWALLAFASTIQAALDPINDFCALSNHMMAIDGDMLYIVGGWMLYDKDENENGGGGRNTIIRSLNISERFQTSLESVDYLGQQLLPDWVPAIESGVWWPTHENRLDLAIGREPDNSGQKKLPDEDRRWSYNTITQNWTEESITLQGWSETNSALRVASPMTEWIPKLKRGYMFSGVFALGTPTGVKDVYDHNGLIVYDAATDVWTNTSTPIRPVTGGGMVHLTTATDEVLIQFGGRSQRANVIEPLSEIHIYSTNQSKWFTHSLGSGPVPAPRFAFCTAIKSAPDGSSHQIYMFSGAESPPGESAGLGGPTTESLWVLTIPTFEWIQLPFGRVSTTADPGGRISPTCTAIGEHYVFYYGGRHVDSYFGLLTCDKKANAAFLFDLNTLSWADQFVPNQERYVVPERVYAVIGGNKDGNATRTAPAGGFKDASLSTILSFAITSSTGAATSSSTPGSLGTSTSTSASTSTSTSASASANSPTPVAAIVGGAVGGVVAIALIATGAIILYRGPRRPPDDDMFPEEPALLGIEYSGGRPTPPVWPHVYPQELYGERATAELQVHPPELIGGRANMAELPGCEVLKEGPSHV